MRTLIIDDENHCIGTLRILLEKHAPDVEIVATCRSGAEGIKAIRKHQPDVVFLDIAMPKMSGFEMLDNIDSPQFDVIFTTAYDSFAVKAFRVSAIDYLLKPIDREELQQALDKLRTTRNTGNGQQAGADQMRLFLENIRQLNQPFPNIAMPTANGVEMVKAADILYAEADGNYTQFVFSTGKTLLISRTLKEVEEMLVAHKFIRVHHSHLVNATQIVRYYKGEGGYVILTDGKQINVSRRRKPELLKALKSI